MGRSRRVPLRGDALARLRGARGCAHGAHRGVSKRATVISVSIAGLVIGLLYGLLANELQAVLDKLEQFFPPWVRIVVAVLAAIVMVWFVAKVVRWFAVHPTDPTEPADATLQK